MVPLNRTAAGNNQLGDLSFRVTAPDGITLADHSIHCARGDASCIISSANTTDTAACQTSCDEAAACESWSWAKASTLCYLLNANTLAPVLDAGADCGFKAGIATFSTAQATGSAKVLPTAPGELAAADLSPLLPGAPLSVQRRYTEDSGDIIITYNFQHDRNASGNVELAPLGMTLTLSNLVPTPRQCGAGLAWGEHGVRSAVHCTLSGAGGRCMLIQ